MRDFMPGELNVPYVEMVALRRSGRLILGIDEGTALRVSNSPLMQGKAAGAAFHVWGMISMGLLLVSVVASFIYAWWWFIPGFVVAMLIHSANKRGNSQNLLELAVENAQFYDAVRAMHLWQYRMSDEDAAHFRAIQAAP